MLNGSPATGMSLGAALSVNVDVVTSTGPQAEPQLIAPSPDVTVPPHHVVSTTTVICALPVPVNESDTLVAPAADNVTIAVRPPVAEGAKVSPRLQLAPPARLFP